MIRDRLNIGTTLRVASLALAIGFVAAPAVAQNADSWNVNGGHSAAGTGGGAGGESGSGSTTERMGMPYERGRPDSFVGGAYERGYDSNTGSFRPSQADMWDDGFTR